MRIVAYRRIALCGMLCYWVVIFWVAISMGRNWPIKETVPLLHRQSQAKQLVDRRDPPDSHQMTIVRSEMLNEKTYVRPEHNPNVTQRTKEAKPEHVRSATPRVWPNPKFPDDDRILAQMKYVPESLQAVNASQVPRDKRILIHRAYGPLAMTFQTRTFADLHCPVSRCIIVKDPDRFDTADVVIFEQNAIAPEQIKPAHQIWLMYLLEPPPFTGIKSFKNLINWTATYRSDSTIVTPYEKFVPFATPVKKIQKKNYAAGKTKKVAWFVSNCFSENNRFGVATELAKYITVDIFGDCGSKSCPRSKEADCFQMLSRDYKFYLAFENSNCVHYVTEKLFRNGLQNDVIPVVMGARSEDYKRVSPPHSYIHVEDFETLKDLAKYLHLLDLNDDLYNAYFRWQGTGEFVNTQFWCRLCALAHDSDHPPSHYEDIQEWWGGKGSCIGMQMWRDVYKVKRQ
ncbi:glycoprotein 3-alpha-L-fucosyltransferase A-like [Liolophura sinensis]|uniref:glycoprotein 3-alpha-L-fucosyltransferase A-like n=1 Tax=Liolophura sinensis TaxID=3198878 RepID=UPI00315943D3